MSDTPWACDVPVSMPNPIDQNATVKVPMFGFAFTDNGLFHDLSTSQHEELRQPTFGPALDIGGIVYDDKDVDG